MQEARMCVCVYSKDLTMYEKENFLENFGNDIFCWDRI